MSGGGVSGPVRFRGRRLIVAAIAALMLPAVWIPAANAGAGPATFVTQGRVEQLAVTSPTTNAVLGRSAAAAANGGGSQSGLPFSGGDVIALALIGIGVLLSGFSLAVCRRRGYPYSPFLDS